MKNPVSNALRGEAPWASLLLLVFIASSHASTANAQETLANDLDRARALQRARELNEASALYRSIAERSRTHDPATAAIALNNLCVCQVELSDAEAALPACEEAATLRRTLDVPQRLARTLNNLGRALMRLGRYEEASVHFREALSINRSQEDVMGEVINIGNLGVIATLVGRYGEALDLQRQIIALSEAHANAPWADGQRYLAILNEGVVLERLGAFDEALTRYKRLIAEGDRLPIRSRAGMLANLATLYRNLGDPVRATASAREAAHLWSEIGDAAGVANAELNLGLILHHSLGRIEEAETAYREALARAEMLADADTEIEARIHLGDLLLAADRAEAAFASFDRARARAEETGSSDGLARALDGLGRVSAQRGDLTAALTHLEGAMETLEGVRAGLDRAALRAQFLSDRRAVFGTAVSVLARLDAEDPDGGYAEQALEVVQRAKHRELLQALGKAGEMMPPARAEDLRAAVGDTANDAARDAMVLEFFQNGDRLFRWTIQRTGISLSDRGAWPVIRDDVRALHRSLAAGDSPRPTVISRLSTSLLGGQIPTTHSTLFIAPDGLLHYLPFEVLSPPDAPGEALLDRAAVVYLPSASLLARPRPDGTPQRSLLALAAPTVDDAERHPLGSVGQLLTKRFALAPLMAQEVERIGASVGGEQLILRGSEAHEEAFRTAAAAGARIVHFATHTVVDERMDAGAAVLLAPAGEDDGLLYPDEIAALAMHTDLTVLAACSTALSSSQEGRGLSSLTGAFLAAGSRGVIATLWDVGDAESAVFMEQLYYQLGRGLAPARALQEAKHRLRENDLWKDPSLWAAYILVGDAPPVVRRGFLRRLGLGPAFGTVLLAAMIITAVAIMLRRGGRQVGATAPPL